MVRICCITLILMIGSALLAPLLAPKPFMEIDPAARLKGPSRSSWFGTDELGRDVFSRILYGGRVSFLVSVAVVTLSCAAGVLVGSISGSAGKWLDELFMRSGDVLLSFPGILLAIGVVAVLGPGLENLVLALVLIGWVPYARLIRGLVLKFREMEFVTASRSLGASPARLLFRHVLPNLVPALMVQVSFGFAGAILSESSLSFLGLGVQPPQPSWGNMLSDGKNHLLDAPQLTLFPGAAIFLAVLLFNLLGDALRDRLDPKFRS